MKPISSLIYLLILAAAAAILWRTGTLIVYEPVCETQENAR